MKNRTTNWRSQHWVYRNGQRSPKHTFSDLEDALRYIRVNKKEGITPYVCGVCGGWHIGHYRYE